MAVFYLENPGLAAELADRIGQPLEKGMELLPAGWRRKIDRSLERSLRLAMRMALLSLGPMRKRESRDRFHTMALAASGAMGGAFGFLSFLMELPVSTTLILRSIADIARSEGEHTGDPDTAMACLEVFALGGRSDRDDRAESGYYAVRTALAGTISDATRFIAKKGMEERGAPAIVRLVSAVAARFGIDVSQRAAAIAIPVAGAALGAAINTIFIQHYQRAARGHFIVRRLERRHGAKRIRTEYIKILKRKNLNS